MAESNEEVLDKSEEQQVDPELERKARDMGWTPKDRYKGDPEKWVDADTYVKKGEEMLPLVKAQNRRLQDELHSLRSREADRDRELKSVKAALKTIEETQTEDLLQAAKDTQDDLEAEIAAASEAGQHQKVAKLSRQLAELIATEKIAKIAPKGASKGEETTEDEAPLTPATKAWLEENNDWYGKDRERTARANAIGQLVSLDGFKHEEFYEELDKRLNPRSRRESRVASGSGGSNSGGTDDNSGGSDKTYSSLPSDAKVACDRQGKYLVGEGKRYKTHADWRKAYAKTYFEL